MIIRTVKTTDFQEIKTLIKSAFETAEHSDNKEHDLVDILRSSSSYIPELELVAVVDNQIVGHIFFTTASVGDESVLVLAPLAVSPSFQNKKIGTNLIRKAHESARELGYFYSVVLGSDTYYPRLGYIQASSLGIKTPLGIDDKYFMAIKLTLDAPLLDGDIVYPKEFGM